MFVSRGEQNASVASALESDIRPAGVLFPNRRFTGAFVLEQMLHKHGALSQCNSVKTVNGDRVKHGTDDGCWNCPSPFLIPFPIRSPDHCNVRTESERFLMNVIFSLKDYTVEY